MPISGHALGIIRPLTLSVRVINYTCAYTYPRPRPRTFGLGAREVPADRERSRRGAFAATFRM